MKKILNKLLKNPILIIFLLILVFYMPAAIYSPGESRNRGVVTAIGIDKIDDQYEVSLLTFIPTVNQSFEEQKSVISAKGSSVAEAVYRAEIAMGRKIGLFHAKTTVVNEELLKEDVAKHLDYLSRVASLPENSVFVGTNKTAKELLKISQKSKNIVGLKLEQLVGFNAENIYVTDTSLEAFYDGYYNDTKSAIIGYLCIEDSNTSFASVEKASMSDDMGSSQSSGNAQNSAQQEKGQSKENLVNCGKSILLKNGKMAEILSADMLNAINILNTKSKNQIIKIKDVMQDGERVNVSYRIKEKKVITTTKFENGYPVFLGRVVLNVELVEIEGVTTQTKVNTDLMEFTDEVKEKIDIEVKRQFSEAISLLKRNNADIIGINKKFFLDNRKAYSNFIAQNGGVENFIKNVNFQLNITAQSD